MSSATSTKAFARKAASYDERAGHSPEAADPGFRVSHFFVLLSLIAATVAVVMARPAAPENLVLISLTIGATGLAAMMFYRTIAPLVSTPTDEEHEPLNARLRADLEREKALTLRSIKELEFDRAMGKLSERDFEQMAARLRERAIGIMRQLEAGSSMYRDQVEKDLAARLGKGAAGARSAAGPPKLSEDAKIRVTTDRGPNRPVGRRPDLQAHQATVSCVCGTANDADARFCKSCGAKLAGSAA
jgi:hypothetical protein